MTLGRRGKTALRGLFAIAVLLGVLWFVGFKTTADVLLGLDPVYIVWLALLSVVLIAVSCLKWQLFLNAAGHRVGLLPLMRHYTTSYFFNLFMPSIVGGDVARSVQLGRELSSYRSIFAATFVERFTGFAAMVLVGLIFVVAGFKITAGIEYAVYSVAAITFCASILLFSRRACDLTAGIVRSIAKLWGLNAITKLVDRWYPKLIETIDFVHGQTGLLFKALAWSLLFHFLAVVNTYVAALAIGWEEASLPGLCVVVPLVLLVSVAPVTPSGIGVQEGAFVFFLTRLGATQPQALAVAILLRAKNLAIAVVGGVIWVLTERGKSATQNGQPSPVRP
jgi:uncharacterized protein (TIRG00374 family)